jgi:DNA polymerase V
MELVASSLKPRGSIQLGLFDPPAGRADAVAEVKRAVNRRVGRWAVRSGGTLWLGNDLYRDAASGFDICDVHGKMCF